MTMGRGLRMMQRSDFKNRLSESKPDEEGCENLKGARDSEKLVSMDGRSYEK